MSFNAGDIEATLDLNRGPFQKGLAESRKEAEAFEKRGIKLRIELDEKSIEKIDRAIGQARKTGARGAVRLPVEVTDEDVAQVKHKLDDIAVNTEKTAQRSGSRFGRLLLNPLVMQLGLIPGIAMAAAAGGALALGVLPVAFAAIGVAAVKSNESLKSTYSELWEGIKTDAKAMAEPLVGTFENVANQIYISWVKLRPELAGIFKDSAPLVEIFVDGVLGLAEEALPRFHKAIALSGPAMRGLNSLMRDTGAGFGEMTMEVAGSSVVVGRSTELVGEVLRNLLRTVGVLVAQFSTFWADVGPQFNNLFVQMLDVVTAFTGSGLSGLNTGLNLTFNSLQVLMDLLGPFVGILSNAGGILLGMVGSWKLWAGAIGLVGKAWGLLSPGSMMTRLQGVSTSFNKAAGSMGGFVTKVSGSDEAGKRFTSTASKVGSAVVKSTSYLPLLGTAIAVTAAIMDEAYPSADKLAEGYLKGGKAAEDAAAKIHTVNPDANMWEDFWGSFEATSSEVRAAISKQLEGMTALERAQMRASAAQADYDLAVQRFGENSGQAGVAQMRLATATGEVAAAQDKAADATKSHNDKIIEQTNLMLGAVGARLNYQSGLLSLEEAQRSLEDAIKKSGKGSLEARQADIQYQQQVLSVVQSLGQRVMAENAVLGETKASELATAAMRQEIARLAVEAGEHLPPSLAEMAAGLTDAELKAMGVTREVDNAGNAIYRLPPGKTLSFPNNAPIARRDVENLTTAVYGLPTGDRWLNYYVNYVVKGAPPTAHGGAPGMIGDTSGRAKGGPVQKNSAYWVGEEGMPELFFPNVDGFVLSGRDSRDVMTRTKDDPGAGTGITRLTSGGDGGAQPDYAVVAELVAEAMGRVLSTTRFEVGGDGMAQLINKTNLRNEAR